MAFPWACVARGVLWLWASCPSWALLLLPHSSFSPVWLFPLLLGCLIGKHNLANAIFPLHCLKVLSNVGYCCALCVQQPQHLQSNDFVSSNNFFSPVSFLWLPEIHCNHFKGDISMNSALPVPVPLMSPIFHLLHFTILVIFRWSPEKKWNQQSIKKKKSAGVRISQWAVPSDQDCISESLLTVLLRGKCRLYWWLWLDKLQIRVEVRTEIATVMLSGKNRCYWEPWLFCAIGLYHW